MNSQEYNITDKEKELKANIRKKELLWNFISFPIGVITVLMLGLLLMHFIGEEEIKLDEFFLTAFLGVIYLFIAIFPGIIIGVFFVLWNIKVIRDFFKYKKDKTFILYNILILASPYIYCAILFVVLIIISNIKESNHYKIQSSITKEVSYQKTILDKGHKIVFHKLKNDTIYIITSNSELPPDVIITIKPNCNNRGGINDNFANLHFYSIHKNKMVKTNCKKGMFSEYCKYEHDTISHTLTTFYKNNEVTEFYHPNRKHNIKKILHFNANECTDSRLDSIVNKKNIEKYHYGFYQKGYKKGYYTCLGTFCGNPSKLDKYCFVVEPEQYGSENRKTLRRNTYIGYSNKYNFSVLKINLDFNFFSKDLRFCLESDNILYLFCDECFYSISLQ